MYMAPDGGLAWCALPPLPPSPALSSPIHTRTGRVGSVMYMAPEVSHGLPYNEKADVFSFAVMGEHENTCWVR